MFSSFLTRSLIFPQGSNFLPFLGLITLKYDVIGLLHIGSFCDIESLNVETPSPTTYFSIIDVD